MLSRFFRRRFLIRLLFIAACLATVVLLAYAEEGWRGRRAWAAYQAEARQRGTRLTLAEYVPPVIPDEENFAAIPLLQDLFKSAEQGQIPADPFRLPGNSGPTGGDPLRDRPTDLLAWRDYFVHVKMLPGPSDEPAADILQALTRFAPGLRQLRSAAARPKARFPVHWEHALTAACPHLGLLQKAVILLGLRAEAHLARGEASAAYDDVTLGFRCYKALEKEPTLIAALFRWSMLSRVESVVLKGATLRAWNDAELNEIQQKFQSLNLLTDCRFAMDSERANLNQLLDGCSTGSSSDAILVFQFAEGLGAAHAWAARLYPRGWIRQNQVVVNRLFDSLDEVIKGGDHQLGPEKEINPGSAEFGHSTYATVYHAPSSLLMPAVAPAVIRAAAAQATASEAGLACALARAQIASGTLPERLEELVPASLPAIPVDPMDGAPLRYRKLGPAEYKIWSIGVNRQDDGGTSVPNKQPTSQPDWVWHVSG